MKRAHLIISGRVQGIGFRYSVRWMASKLNLKGWVRNTEDGNVEAVAEGSEENLRKLIEFCRKGPDIAQVTDIKIKYMPSTGEFRGFEIRH